MENSDDKDNNNMFEPLLKRRKQLAALAKYHRKNNMRASKGFSSIEYADENLQPVKTKETISQVKMTSQHEIVQTKHSISRDTIEDTDEETSLNRRSTPKLTIYSSSENDSNTSSFPINQILVDNDQTSPVKRKCNPNKTIKVLSTVILKKSSESGKIIYLGAEKNNLSTTSNIIQQKIKISLASVQVIGNQNINETIPQEMMTRSETHKDSSDATSNIQYLQQPAISSPTATTFTDASMVVHSDPENLEDKSNTIFCYSPQQSSNLPSTVAKICNTDLTRSETCKDSSDASRVGTSSLQPSAITSPTVATFTDASMIVHLDPENLEDKSNAIFCYSSQQSSNLLSTVAKICSTDCTRSETCEDSSNASRVGTSSLQQAVITSPTVATFTDASMIVHSDPENLEDKSNAIFCYSPQQSSNLPSTVAKICSTDLTRSETCKDSSDASRVGTSSLQPSAITSPTVATFTDASMIVHLGPENLENKSNAIFCYSPQQSSNLLSTVAKICSTDLTPSEICEDSSNASRVGTSSLQQSAITSPTVATFTDASMIVHSDSENLEDKSGATFCDSPQSPSVASVIGKNESNISESNDDIAKVPTKRKRRNLYTIKAFIDFLSDEDKQDYSAGSSDLWSCNESELSSDEKQNINMKKKKKKKKNDKSETNNTEIKKKEKPINNRKVNKKLKDEGKAYENRKGEIVSEKSMKRNPCVPGKCARGCYDISEEKRTSLFEYFWSLDSQRRKDWIVHCAHKTPIKRRKTNNDLSRRNITYEYFINDGEGHKQVCQKFLIDTLGITQKYIIYTLGNAKEDMAQKDLRKPNVSKKFTEEAKAFAKNFIEMLPAVPSHYNRKKTNRTYLPQEMKNILNLYEMYLKYCTEHDHQALSQNAFRTIFKEYNISFHIPKKDKCLTCVKAENNKDQMSDKDKELLKLHHKEKKATYKRFKIHQTLKSLNNETVTCSFDLQKVLNTPYGQSMLLYYSRKYSVYNFTIYESGTQDVHCFTWGECDGKRGSNEIATCLIKYLEEKDKKGVKHLLMYCDSCSGQNKNKTVLAAMNHFLKSAINLEVIQINYLLPGHTYMPVDTVHAVIEREVRKIIVWSPSQWPTYFESARKRPRPYKVNVMDYSDFLNFDQLATNTFTPMTLKNIKFKDIRVATLKRKNIDQIFIKYSMQDYEQTHPITLRETSGKGKGRGKRKGQSKGKKSQPNESLTDMAAVKQLYNYRIPIAAAKYKDLINLCQNGTIPKRFHNEYRELPCNSELRETLNETDEEDEEKSEQEDEQIN